MSKSPDESDDEATKTAFADSADGDDVTTKTMTKAHSSEGDNEATKRRDVV